MILAMYGADWNQIGMDWTALAIELNRASGEHRPMSLIDFDAQGQVIDQRQMRYRDEFDA
jgi:hypothetical protein